MNPAADPKWLTPDTMNSCRSLKDVLKNFRPLNKLSGFHGVGSTTDPEHSCEKFLLKTVNANGNEIFISGICIGAYIFHPI